MRKLVLLAAEASGDLLGGRLMVALKKQGFDGHFLGLGGEAMEKEGLEIFYPQSAVSFFALIDVLLNGVQLLWRVRQIANKIIAAEPDGVVLIDGYDLNHRIARSVFRRAPKIKIINYVPPKAWVWRAGRAKKMKNYITHCLTLFPFEVDFFQSHGVPSSYVGHPALEHIANAEQVENFRRQIGADKKIVLIALGSRNTELKRLAPIFGKALPKIKAAHAGVEFFMPVASTMKDKIQTAMAGWEIQPQLVWEEGEKQALFAAADVALVASGTIILELGLSGTASVCVYRLNKIEEWIFKFFLKSKWVGLVNLILQRSALPELLGAKDANPEAFAQETLRLLAQDCTPLLLEFKQKLETSKPPSAMAAEKILQLIAC